MNIKVFKNNMVVINKEIKIVTFGLINIKHNKFAKYYTFISNKN